MKHSGFTLIEMIIVIGVLTVLLTITTLSLGSIRNQASVNGTVNQLLGDIKSQQLRAMTGDAQTADTASPYGLYFLSDRYILFRGAAYSSSDPGNLTVLVAYPLSLSTTFPASTLLFSPGSGEIVGFVASSDTISILDTSLSTGKVIQLNRYGILTSQI